MHPRLKALELRLARLAGMLRDRAQEVAQEREVYAARRAVAALIRAGLERAGLNPDEAPALLRLEALPPPPLPPAPPRRIADPAEAFLAKLRALAERMRGQPPTLANASPAQLLAFYCLGADGPSGLPA